MILSRNLVMAMSTLKETRTAKSSRQGSSSGSSAAFSLYSYGKTLKTSCSQLLTAFTCALNCLLSYVEINVYSNYVYFVSVALKVPQNAISRLRASIFKNFQGACPQTPLALYVLQEAIFDWSGKVSMHIMMM